MKRLHMCDQIICEDSFFNNSCQDTDTGSKEKYKDKQEKASTHSLGFIQKV